MKNPKIILLIDGLGALLSTFSIGVLLVKFENLIGMPVKTLYLLSTIAAIFCIYSLSCYSFVKKNWKKYVRPIAIANLVYCVISIGLVLIHFEKLTLLGLSYFIIEILVLIILIKFEFKIISDQSIK